MAIEPIGLTRKFEAYRPFQAKPETSIEQISIVEAIEANDDDREDTRSDTTSVTSEVISVTETRTYQIEQQLVTNLNLALQVEREQIPTSSNYSTQQRRTHKLVILGSMTLDVIA